MLKPQFPAERPKFCGRLGLVVRLHCTTMTDVVEEDRESRRVSVPSDMCCPLGFCASGSFVTSNVDRRDPRCDLAYLADARTQIHRHVRLFSLSLSLSLCGCRSPPARASFRSPADAFRPADLVFCPKCRSFTRRERQVTCLPKSARRLTSLIRCRSGRRSRCRFSDGKRRNGTRSGPCLDDRHMQCVHGLQGQRRPIDSWLLQH